MPDVARSTARKGGLLAGLVAASLAFALALILITAANVAPGEHVRYTGIAIAGAVVLGLVVGFVLGRE